METARVYKTTLPTSNSLLLCKGMLLQLFGFVTAYFVFFPWQLWAELVLGFLPSGFGCE